MEQLLYAQVGMLIQKYFKVTEANKYKNDDKFKVQGQSARSHRWIDLGFDFIEETFRTHEPDFYRKIYQRHAKTQDKNTFKMFEFPIRNTKCVEEMRFRSKAQMLKYCQIC